MERGKKLTLVIALVLIALVALGLSLTMVLGTGRPKPPEWYLKLPVEKIDQNSYKLISKTAAEWQRLGEQNGKFKNPETGAYTMVEPLWCQGCKAKIPTPEGLTHGTVAVFRSTYKCPKCGKNPWTGR